jgi:hypothetical protein
VQAGKPPLEASLRDLPWLGQVVETVRRDLPPGGGYHVELGGLGRGATIEAIDLRLRYLLLPAQAVPPEQAALVIVAAGSLAGYEGSPEWERIATLEGGLPVYRRRIPS